MARSEINVMWIEASDEEELAMQVAPASPPSSSVEGMRMVASLAVGKDDAAR
jgi:hypothetical protein